MDRHRRGRRQRRLWLVVPCVLAAIGVAASALTLLGLWRGGLPRHTFAPSESVTVRLNARVQADLYVTGPAGPGARCAVAAPSGRRVVAEPVSGTYAVTVHGARWSQLATLNPPATGTYTVTCAAAAPGVRYGISAPPAAGTLAAGFAGGMGLVVAAGLLTFALLDRYGPRHGGRRPVRPAPSWEVEPTPQRVR